MKSSDLLDLQGHVALVTGAARGQGRAYCIKLADQGADIIGIDLCRDIASSPYPLGTAEELAETVACVEKLGRRMLSFEVDVREQQALDDAVGTGLERFGRIDVAVPCAGLWSTTPFWELEESRWQDLVDTNLGGVWRTCKAVAPHMMQRRRGSIVVIASTSGFEPGSGYAHYVASKHGVIGLVKNIALELSPYGIRCNAVAPSTVDTPMSNWQGAYDMVAGHSGGTRSDYVRLSKGWHALPDTPALDPAILAEVVLWLASPASGAITGVTIPVDAGHLLIPGVVPEHAEDPS
jgi:SDR family mycofactocin-dependent oxidoreductase